MRGKRSRKWLLGLGGLVALGSFAVAMPAEAERGPDQMQVQWLGDGDEACIFDMLPDGYASRMSVYRYYGRDPNGKEQWVYAGITATAPSRGEKDCDANNLAEGQRVMVHTYIVNRYGTACHNWWKTDRGGNWLNTSDNDGWVQNCDGDRHL